MTTKSDKRWITIVTRSSPRYVVSICILNQDYSGEYFIMNFDDKEYCEGVVSPLLPIERQKIDSIINKIDFNELHNDFIPIDPYYMCDGSSTYYEIRNNGEIDSISIGSGEDMDNESYRTLMKLDSYVSRLCYENCKRSKIIDETLVYEKFDSLYRSVKESANHN